MSTEIQDRREEVLRLFARYAQHRSGQGLDDDTYTSPPLSDEKVLGLLRSAKNKDKFERLYDQGDLTGYGGDDSAADQALVNLIYFYTQDEDQIDRIFQGSALCRSKWTNRPDYRERTINRARESLSEVYQPDDGARLIVGGGGARNVHRGASLSPSLIEKGQGHLTIERFADTPPPNKPREFIMFGSVYKSNMVRSVFQVEATEREEGALNLVVRHKKMNFGPMMDPLGVRIEFEYARTIVKERELAPEDLAEEGTLNAKDRVLLALEDGAAFPDDLAERTGLAKKTVKNALTRLHKAGKVEHTGNVDPRSQAQEVSLVSPTIKGQGRGHLPEAQDDPEKDPTPAEVSQTFEALKRAREEDTYLMPSCSWSDEDFAGMAGSFGPRYLRRVPSVAEMRAAAAMYEEWERDRRTDPSSESSEPDHDDSDFLEADYPEEDEAFGEEYDNVSRGLRAMFEEHPETRYLGPEELAHVLADAGLVSPEPDTVTVEIARENL